MPLKRIRHAVLPLAALAAWGVTAWAAAGGVDRDDVIPTGAAVVLTVWALLDYYYVKSFRETRAARVQVEQALPTLAEGVAAAIREKDPGDGQRSKSG